MRFVGEPQPGYARREAVTCQPRTPTRGRSSLLVRRASTSISALASPTTSADAAVLTRDFAARDDCTALSLSCRRPRCGRASTQRGTPRGGSLPASTLLPGLLRRVHLPARSRSSSALAAAAAQARGEAEHGRGVPRHRRRARRAGAAGARRGGGRGRLGDHELAKRRYEQVLEATTAPTARTRAAQVLAQLRGETVAGEPEERPSGGLSIRPNAPALSGSTHASSGQATGSAARYARDALALLEYADDLQARVARVGGGARRGGGW